MNQIVNIQNNFLESLAQNFASYVKTCKSFSLICRDEVLSNKENDFLVKLNSHLIKKEKISAWPGTVLSGGKALICYYYLNEETLEILQTVESLFNFLSPDYPEDPCFYKGDGSPYLITISHEKDLYFNVKAEEMEFLSKKLISNGIAISN